ncbi:ABC transporter [Clostridiales bacterium PH28_bin88]|nr:ABC transporter [Clostridiales bacterium PH28_bin88]
MFMKRGFLHAFSYKTALVLTILGTLIGILKFGFMAGFLQDGNSFPMLTEYGGNLFAYLITGSAFMSFVSLSLNSFQGAIRNEQQMGTLEHLLMSNIPLGQILLYSGLWNFFFTFLNTSVLFAVAIFMFDVPVNVNIPLTLLILFLSIVALSGIGLASAGVIMVTKVGDPINWAFVTFSGFASGVLFPVEVLPGPLQLIANVLPTTHALKALRLAITKNITLPVVNSEIWFLVLTSIITIPLGFIIFTWGFNKAREAGSLSEY